MFLRMEDLTVRPVTLNANSSVNLRNRFKLQQLKQVEVQELLHLLSFTILNLLFSIENKFCNSLPVLSDLYYHWVDFIWFTENAYPWQLKIFKPQYYTNDCVNFFSVKELIIRPKAGHVVAVPVLYPVLMSQLAMSMIAGTPTLQLCSVNRM
jgi:hypothetical protein